VPRLAINPLLTMAYRLLLGWIGYAFGGTGCAEMGQLVVFCSGIFPDLRREYSRFRPYGPRFVRCGRRRAGMWEPFAETF
jgi:hypothetical protein